MKKILVVSMSAELGGIEKSLINFLRYLGKCDCTVDLMLWKKRGQLLADIPKHVNIIDSPAPGNIRNIIKGKKISKLIAYLKLKKYTKKHIPWKSFPNLSQKYDIAISYTQDGYSPYYVIDNVNAEKKFLWYHHGAYIHLNKKKERDQKYYQKFNRVITVSEANRQMLCDQFSRIQEQFCVIPNLIDEENVIKFAQYVCDAFKSFEGCKITTVGRLSPEKGQLRSLEVAEYLKKIGFAFKWCFVGDGPDGEECLRQIREKNLEDCCIFVGTQVNPYPYMKAADLYVQLSFVEADPVTIQEALILKKVIIASDILSIREALKDGKLGVLCGTKIEDIGKSIVNLYEDKLKIEEIILEIEQSKKRNDKVENMLNALLFK